MNFLVVIIIKLIFIKSLDVTGLWKMGYLDFTACTTVGFYFKASCIFSQCGKMELLFSTFLA
jgi:hypothetical protein